MVRLVDSLFEWARSRPLLYRFALFTRILLAAGFIPTGMVKLLGHRFTLLPADNPVGAFFEAMYQTGLYWRFLGASQVVAGLMLLVPPLAHLGAAMFVPIIANIFVVTVALDFTGTPFVTAPMLLAAMYLFMWDYHRFRSMLSAKHRELRVTQHSLDPVEFLGFLIFAASIVVVFALIRGLAGPRLIRLAVAAGFAGGLLALGRYVWVFWVRPSVAARAASPRGCGAG